MCFGDKNSGDHDGLGPRPVSSKQQQQGNGSSKPGPSQTKHDYSPPPGPPPSHSQQQYAPPPGPPPSHGAAVVNDYAPPPGPPPSNQPAAGGADYAPPPGPPPSKGGQSSAADDFAPPPDPPPDHSASGGQPSQPKLHNWEEAVPDTSLFPPPPAFFSGFDRSPAHNATEAEANAGEAWCEAHPMAPPQPLDDAALVALRDSNFRLIPPAGYAGELTWLGKGRWKGRSVRGSRDSCIVAYPPIYSVRIHSPIASGGGGRKLLYFEVKIAPKAPSSGWHLGAGHNSDEVTLALGYVVLPYPGFRLPGWHRGSLAVHGDDGHRYVNDLWGGNSFTAPFRKGETIGLGMELTAEPGSGRIEVSVFLTRNGREDNRWDLHMEVDNERERPVTGLEGYHDLSAAIGTFEETEWECVMDPEGWAWQGWKARN